MRILVDRARHQRRGPLPGPGRSPPVAGGVRADRPADRDEPGYLSLVTVVEIYWVLRRAYRVGADQCADLLQGLLDARELRVDQDAIVRAALTASGGGPDFADAVIVELGRAAGCDRTVTFDQRPARDGAMQFLGARGHQSGS